MPHDHTSIGSRARRPQTELVRGGLERSAFGETSEGLFLTSGYVYPSPEAAEAAFKGEIKRYQYSRYANPTVAMFEERLRLIEGAETCYATATGMAAVFAAIMCQVKAGDRVVASRALFGSCDYIIAELLPRYGIESVLVDGTDMDAWERALSRPTACVFIETPSNPTLEIIDIAAVAELAQHHELRETLDAWGRIVGSPTPEALDRLLAWAESDDSALPAWSTAHEGGWIKQHWREPTVKEVMQVLQDAVRLCEVCMESVGQIATAALAQRPVVERAQITQDVAPQYTAQVQTLQDQLAALPRPKDTPKAQQPPLRHTKTQLQQELKTLLRAQETAIQRQVTAGTNARRKLEKLVAKTPGQRDTLLHRVSKVSRDVLAQMVWIYDYERRGDDDWRAAKRDVRRWLRTLRQARAPAEVEATP